MKIEFIIPAYGRPTNLIMTLGSLFSQTNPNFKVHVVADTKYDGFDWAISPFQHDDRLQVTVLDKRHNDWGHTPRNVGLDMATEEWVVMTGDDNYYAPIFVEEFLSVVDDKTGFVYCDMVHNGHNSNMYRPVMCKIKHGDIDMGNFMTRRDLVGDLRLKTDEFSADWLFIRDYLSRNSGVGVRKIHKWLYVHN